MNIKEIQDTIKEYILAEFLPGEDPAALTETTPMATTGILDSIGVLKIVTFLESRFDVTLQAHETGVENMNTIDDIAKLVASKKG